MSLCNLGLADFFFPFFLLFSFGFFIFLFPQEEVITFSNQL